MCPVYPPAKYRFLERNRLTSGLSGAVLIHEAAARSGTLSTAARALEQGKEAFVMSDNITSPISEGRTQLIHQGATPVTKVEDILEIILPSALEQQLKIRLGTTRRKPRSSNYSHKVSVTAKNCSEPVH